MDTPITRYCYRCGKRVRKQTPSGHCWYCDAPIERNVRPSRRCPFCEKKIGHKAIKCPYCQEFLDHRKDQSVGGGTPGQINYIIDKAVIQQGSLPTPEQNPALPSPQASALPAPQAPPQLEAPSPLQLPMHGEPSGTMDGEIEQETILAEDGALIRSPSAVPAEIAQDNHALEVAHADGGLLARAGGVIWGKKSEDEEDYIDAEIAESPYRDCPICETEILTNDNFCFSCGGDVRPVEERPEKRKPTRIHRTVFEMYFGFVLVIIGMLFFNEREELAGNPIALGVMSGLGGLAGFLLFIALVRKPTASNMLPFLVSFAVWIMAILWIFF